MNPDEPGTVTWQARCPTCPAIVTWVARHGQPQPPATPQCPRCHAQRLHP